MQYLMEIFDLRGNVTWKITDEKTSVMSYVGIFNFAHTIIIKILNHIMAKKITPCNNTEFNVCIAQALIDMVSRDLGGRGEESW